MPYFLFPRAKFPLCALGNKIKEEIIFLALYDHVNNLHAEVMSILIQ